MGLNETKETAVVPVMIIPYGSLRVSTADVYAEKRLKNKVLPYENAAGIGIPLHLIHGSLGTPAAGNTVTGPCYLTSAEIRSLGKSTTIADMKKMTRMHPTFEDIACSPISYHVGGKINDWQETHHYAKLVSHKTGLPYHELVHLFQEEAFFIYEAQRKASSLAGYENDVNLVWTHEKETQEMLKYISAKYAEQYLDVAQNKTANLISAIKTNPSECSQLQIVSTYSPEANGDKSVTAIESVQNLDNILPAHRIFGTNAVLLKEPKDSKSQSLRMNSSQSDNIIYLGPEADFQQEIEKLAYGTKKPAGCGVFGLLSMSANGKTRDFEDSCNGAEKKTKKETACHGCLNYLIPILEYMKVEE